MGKKQSNLYKKPMSVFCAYCGCSVPENSSECPNSKCMSHKDNITFSSNDRCCCAYCKQCFTNVTLRTKKCPNEQCEHSFHSVIVNKYRYTYH